MWHEKFQQHQYRKHIKLAALGIIILLLIIITISITLNKSNKGESHALTAHEILGRSFYLPKIDIYNPKSNGFIVFKYINPSCYKSKELRETKENIAYYSNTQEFYKSLGADGGLSGSFIGKYTMGATLGAKAEMSSGGSVDVNGMSIEKYNLVKSLFLDENCFKNSEVEFTNDFMKAFDSLPVTINKPWLKKSWQQYGWFLTNFGSHLILELYLGASMRQWTFAKITDNYSKKDINARACLDFSEIRGSVKACFGFSKTDIMTYKTKDASSYLEVRGGKDETRNKFSIRKSEKLLVQILNEGRQVNSPVKYKYKAIWNIILTKFHNNTERYAKAMNLMLYYIGFEDFGCTLIDSGGQKLRSFENQSNDYKSPSFKCVLINKGCHKDSDCKVDSLLGPLKIGLKTHCYGSTCYEYRNPKFGLRAKTVVARRSKKGDTNEGINMSCQLKNPTKASCTKNKFGPEVIWDSRSISYN